MDTPPAIICEAPRAVDGDNIRCKNVRQSIRLLGIDAPEMKAKCTKRSGCIDGDGPAAKRALAELLRRGRVTVRAQGFDLYGRILARVTVRATTGTIDLSCQMITTGHAVRRYSPIDC